MSDISQIIINNNQYNLKDPNGIRVTEKRRQSDINNMLSFSEYAPDHTYTPSQLGALVNGSAELQAAWNGGKIEEVLPVGSILTMPTVTVNPELGGTPYSEGGQRWLYAGTLDYTMKEPQTSASRCGTKYSIFLLLDHYKALGKQNASDTNAIYPSINEMRKTNDLNGPTQVSGSVYTTDVYKAQVTELSKAANLQIMKFMEDAGLTSTFVAQEPLKTIKKHNSARGLSARLLSTSNANLVNATVQAAYKFSGTSAPHFEQNQSTQTVGFLTSKNVFGEKIFERYIGRLSQQLTEYYGDPMRTYDNCYEWGGVDPLYKIQFPVFKYSDFPFSALMPNYQTTSEKILFDEKRLIVVKGTVSGSTTYAKQREVYPVMELSRPNGWSANADIEFDTYLYDLDTGNSDWYYVRMIPYVAVQIGRP